MIRSMTGFGAASGTLAGRTITVEIKSVNNRFREVVVRSPKIFAPLEDQIKKQVAAKIERGRLDLWVQLDEKDLKRQNLKADLPLAQDIKKILDELRQNLGLNSEINLSHLLSFGIIKMEDEAPDLEELWGALAPIVDEAVDKLIIMRTKEGECLNHDLTERINKLALWNKQMEGLLADAPKLHLEKLKSRLTELCDSLNIDPTRLAQEAALIADKADITEEVVRLSSHLARFNEIMADQDATGRRLDFLLQEMGREVNTMGSKSQDLQVTALVLDMKAELEKLREQVQNIE